jgi:hypothetical protein
MAKNFRDEAENDSESKSPQSFEVSYAGIIRPLLVSLLKRTSTFKFLPKSIAKSADNLSTVIELREHYYVAKQHKQKHRLTRLYSLLIPAFFRNSIFGTVVFSTYETLYAPYTKNSQFAIAPPFLIGGLAGAMGGMSYVIFDRIIHLLKITQVHSPNHVESKMIKYGISHGIMFSTYEYTKWYCLVNGWKDSIQSYLQRWNHQLAMTLKPSTFTNHLITPQAQVPPSSSRTASTNNQRGLFEATTIETMSLACCISIAGSIAGLTYEVKGTNSNNSITTTTNSLDEKSIT